jgi:hypothetical protein
VGALNLSGHQLAGEAFKVCTWVKVCQLGVGVGGGCPGVNRDPGEGFN